MASNAELVMLYRARDETARVHQQMISHLSRIQGGVTGVLATGAKIGGTVVAWQALSGSIQGVAQRLGSIVGEASGVSESINKIDVVFKGAAESVKRFTDNSATGLGLSRGAALEADGTFGNLFTAMGIGEGRAADMSTELLSLAADLASFNNISVDEALIKLRAGLVGETEPLRTLGVNLTAATVEAKGLEMGLITQGQTLTAAGKAQAAYALIFQQTASAQGDFARTADGLANSTRTLGARFDDLRASAGKALLPLWAEGTKVLNDFFAGLESRGDVTRFTADLEARGEAVRQFAADVQRISGDGGLSVLDSSLTVIASRIREAFGDDNARLFERMTTGVGNLASGLGGFVSGQLIPGAGRLAEFAGRLSDAAVNGRSFGAAIGPAGQALDVLRGGLERINPLLRDHKELLLGVGAGAGAFVALRAAIPIVLGLATAMAALSKALAAGGAGAGLGALVATLGGPLTLAIAGVALAVGLLATAWAGDWGNIREIAAISTRAVGQTFSDLGTDIQQSGIAEGIKAVRDATTDLADAVSRAAGRIQIGTTDIRVAFLDLASRVIPAVAVVRKALELLGQGVDDTREGLSRIGEQAGTDRQQREIAEGLDEVRTRREQGLAEIKAETDRIVAANARRAQSDAELAALEERLREIREQPSQSGGTTGTDPDEKEKKAKKDLERSKTAIEGFMAELGRDGIRIERTLGELGARIWDSFADASESNSDSAGEALARGLQDLRREAERLGLTNVKELSDNLAGDFHDALIDRMNPALRAAAFENLRAYTETIRSANALSPESFSRALGLESARAALGSGGQSVMEALGNAIKEGGAQAIASLAQSVAAMRRTLFEDHDVSPERAREVWGRIFEAVNTAIADGSAEARTNLESFFRDLNFEQLTMKVGDQLAKRLKAAGKDLADAVKNATKQAREQIQQATASLAESRSQRAVREGFADTQKDNLEKITRLVDRQRQAYHDLNEERDVGRRRDREDADLTRRRLQEDIDLQKRGQESRGNTTLGRGVSDEMRTELATRGITVGADPLADPSHRANAERRALAERRGLEDTERTRRRAEEDSDLLRARADREADFLAEKGFAERISMFREIQAMRLRTFEDGLADQALANQSNRIGKEYAASVIALVARYDEQAREANQWHTGEMERIDLQRDSWDTVMDGYLEDLAEADRRMEKLSAGRLGMPLSSQLGGEDLWPLKMEKGEKGSEPGFGGAGEGGVTIAPIYNQNAPIFGVDGLEAVFDLFKSKIIADVNSYGLVSG